MFYCGSEDHIESCKGCSSWIEEAQMCIHDPDYPEWWERNIASDKEKLEAWKEKYFK